VKDWTPDSLRALAELWPRREITDVRVQPANLETVFSELARAEEGLH
jgi:ABC-2 type transport system ATP-binding protein